MKHLKYLLLITGVFVFAFCSESDVEKEVEADSKRASFSGSIGKFTTRVTNDSWDNGDVIGVFALMHKSDPTAVYEEKYNEKYITTGDNKFTAANAEGVINFPNRGKLDFAAYYPWQEKITNFEYTIVAGADPLYSNNATSKNKEEATVDLEFRHMLSKLLLNIEIGYNSTSLKGLNAFFNNVVVTGNFNLASGAVSLDRTKQKVAATVNIGKENKSATATLLMMPTQDLKDVEVLFSLGENSYKWSPKTSMKLASNKEYIYNLKLNLEAQPFVMEVGTVTIKGWEEGHKESTFESLDPENEGSSLGFVSSLTSIDFGANSQLSRIVTLTTDETQAWTMTNNADWLTLNPDVGGTGSRDITITATKNTETTERTAIVAIVPTDNKELEPIIITVIQKGMPTSDKNDGTKERPYTVAEAVANIGEENNKDYVWVEAYIVGTKTSGLSLDGAVETNLLIADNKEESDVSNAMPAQLLMNDIREKINLKHNPAMYKAKVLLYGTLDYYFRSPGLRGIKDFELISTDK